MTIASEITRIQNNIAAAYTAADAKGATMPATQNSANLATCISSISGGGGYEGIPLEVDSNGVLKKPFTSFSYTLPAGTLNIDASLMNATFSSNTAISSFNAGSLTTLSNSSSLYQVCQSCTNLTSVSFPNLATVSGQNVLYQAFRGCTNLTSISLPSITTISGNSAMRYLCQNCTNLTGEVDLSNVGTVGEYALDSAFYNTKITGIKLPYATGSSGTYNMQSMCYSCPSLTSIDFSGRQTINRNYEFTSAFGRCTSLASVDMSSITSISGTSSCNGMFSGCTSLSSVLLTGLESVSGSGSSPLYHMFENTAVTVMTFPRLTSITAPSAFREMFSSCTSLNTVTFGALDTLTGSQAFNNCFKNSTVTSISFPALTSTSFGSNTNQFYQMLTGVTGCTVHFPSNLQSVIGSWSDVTAGFAGTNTTVLFDLAATT